MLHVKQFPVFAQNNEFDVVIRLLSVKAEMATGCC